MPGFDRTGPMGGGPATGGGFGYCGPNAAVGDFSGYGARGGFGTGRRFLRAYGCRFGRGRWMPIWGQTGFYSNYPAMRQEEERVFLQDRIADLKANLSALEKRMASLEESPKSSD